MAAAVADADAGLARGELFTASDDLVKLIGLPATTPHEAVRNAATSRDFRAELLHVVVSVQQRVAGFIRASTAMWGNVAQLAEIREIAGTLGTPPASGRRGTLTLNSVASPGPGPFGNVQLLRNHWSGPARPRACYWYLTFADDAAICDLAARSQRALAFPYYDPVPPHGLHMTIDRIAPEGRITAAQLNSVSAAARLACQAISPFRISLGELSGTRGAIGFAVTPVAPISQLRDTLRAATLSACPDAAATREDMMIPHITIAYGNIDGVPAADVIAAVERLNLFILLPPRGPCRSGRGPDGTPKIGCRCGMPVATVRR